MPLPSLEKNRAMYERLGRVMRVYCPQCGERLLAEQGGIEIIQAAPQLAKYFNRG
jgi:ribosomal protein S27E